MPDVDPPESEVSEALDRLLAWPEIARSAHLTGFLSYIVRKTLQGESATIKAYSIAVDVLNRSSDFDPQADPIVRVQARRLRSLLEQYYATVGAGETLRIELPTGRYVPEFVRVAAGGAAAAPVTVDDSLAPSRRLGRFPKSWFQLALLTAVLSLLAFGVSLWGQQNDGGGAPRGLMQAPNVMVMEMQGLEGADFGGRTVAGLAVELVTDLEQFEAITMRYGGAGPTVEAGADYVLSGIVRREAGGLQYSAILKEVASNSVVWNKAVLVSADDMADPDLLDRVSGQLSIALGNPRGPLHARARVLLAQGQAIEGGETVYLCRVLFDLYRERGTNGAGERAQRCYNALLPEEQQTGLVVAATAILLAEGIGEAVEPEDDARLTQADERLRQALILSPTSGFVWEQRARYLERIGDDVAAEAAYSSALQLNPASADALAARARHLALTGRLADAEPLSRRAVDSASTPPRWYLAVPALSAYRAGNYGLAALYARSYAEADSELGPILVVMAGQALADQEIIASYLPRVLEVPSFRAAGVLTQLRQRIKDETLLRDIRQALLSAGLPPGVLNSPF